METITKKLNVFLFFLLMLAGESWGQGNETFSTIGTNSSYATRTWAGVGGTWTATDAREDQTINGKAITIRNGAVTSPSVVGGIGNLTVSTQLKFSATASNLNVTVNGVAVGTIAYSSSVGTFSINNINVTGSIQIVITNSAIPANRIAIDDVIWTGYTGAVAPAINLQGNATNITNGSTTPLLTNFTNFGNVIVSNSFTRTFTIQNTGSAALNITGAISISGVNAADFSVTTAPSSPIATSSNTTFVVTFTPSASGLRVATLSIPNDDPAKNPYTFAIQGNGIPNEPEINLQGNATNIINNDATPSPTDFTDFGTIINGNTFNRTFTIQNTGVATLTLSTPILTGAGFTLFTAPALSVIAGGSTTFTIRFTATAAGTFTGTISIANNDSDENPYNFAIQANCIANEPEINIQGNATNIVNNDVTPSPTDFTDFGSVITGNTADRIFTIQNTGVATLTLSTPILTGAGFTLFTAPSLSVIAGGSTTFTVRFTATAIGTFNGTINIPNNDTDENPYIFAIVAITIAASPELQIQTNTTTTNRACGYTLAFGTLQIGQSIDQIIRVRNLGLGTLSISGAVLSGAAAAEFAIITPPAPNVAGGSFTDIRVRHTGATSGAKTALITITNNDADEGSCIINFTSTVSAGTYLEPGDLAILGFNASTGSGGDEIVFVCFKDITVGTTIDITDNAFGKCPTNEANPVIYPAGSTSPDPNSGWGVSEGWVRLTKNAGTTPAGTIITVRINTGVSATVISPTGWSGTLINTGSGFDLNNTGEQIFFLAGATPLGGAGVPCHTPNSPGTYTGGRFLYGFNTKGNIWTPECQNGNGSSNAGSCGVTGTNPVDNKARSGTQNSAKPAGFDCFLVWPTAQADFCAYTGVLTTTSKREWIKRIGDTNNWTGYTSTGNYQIYADASLIGQAITITNGDFSAGIWVGDKNTDWFECSNWQNARVPDQFTDVEIGTEAIADVLIDVSSPFAPFAPTVNIADCKNFVIKAATTKKMNFPATGTNTLRIYGDWNNQKTTTDFTEGTGTLDFRGNIDQNIVTADANETFGNITLNKGSGSNIILGGNIITNNNFTFNSNSLVVLSSFNKTVTGNIVGANASRYFQTENNYLSGGFLIQNVPNGSTKVFPVGNTDYTPATIGNTGTTNNMQIRVFDDVYSGGNSGTILPSATLENTVKKTWEITPLGAGFVADITLQWTTTGSTFNPAACWIEKNPGIIGGWIASPSGAAIGSTRLLAGVNSFSKFTVNSVIILPIELVSFSAKINQNNQAQLDWITVSELNAKGFDIEKSFDGKSFEKIGYQNSLGGVDIIKNYQFFDKNFKNAAYYRLKMIDNDNSFKYSKTIYLNNQKTNNYQLTIVPNPTQGEVKLLLGNALPTENVTLKVFSITGKEVISLFGDILEVERQLSNQLLQVPAGMYVVRMQIGEQILQTKLIKN